MIKKIIFLLSIFFLLPLVSSIEIEMKSEMDQGETLLAKISGNFFEPITKEDIIFQKDGHIRSPTVFSLDKINGDFYVYAQLTGKQAGNYSMIIENAKYYRINEMIEEDLITTFSISENSSDFSVSPGFVSTGGEFFIEIQNLRNEEILVSSRLIEELEKTGGGFFENLFGGTTGVAGESLSSVNLKSWEKKNMNFDSQNFSQGLNYLELSTQNTTYNIPIFVSEEVTKSTISNEGFDFREFYLNVSLSSDSNETRIIKIFNDGEKTIQNISISLSDNLKPYATLLTNNISNLDMNSSEEIEIVFNAYGEEKLIEGQLIAESIDYSVDLIVFLNILNEVKSNGEGRVESCSELAGNLCDETQICKGKSELTTDGNCCIGSCQNKTDENSLAVILGWILILFVLGYGVWFYLKKYRKVEGVSSIIKILLGKK